MNSLRVCHLGDRISHVVSVLLYVYEHNLIQTLVIGCACYTVGLFFAATFFAVGEPIPLFVGVAFLICYVVFYSKASSNLAKKENEPYQTLRSLELGSKIIYCSLAVFMSSLIMIFAAGLMGVSLSEHYYVSLILGVSLWISLILVVVSSLLLFYASSVISYHKESRLCFRVILSVLERAAIESKSEREFVAKKSYFFRRAFDSIRTYLAGKPFALELKNVGNYYNAVYTVAVVGDNEEIEHICENIHSILDAMGDRAKNMRLRKFLLVLARLIQPDYEATSLELSELWRVSSRFERIKSKLGSPMTSPTIAIIAVAVAIIFGVLNLLS